MKQHDLMRAWHHVAANIDDPTYTLACVAFTAGFLAGGDMPYGAAVIVALAEKVFGHHPDLTAVKVKLGLGGRIEGA
jgi:hypothetical protein